MSVAALTFPIQEAPAQKFTATEQRVRGIAKRLVHRLLNYGLIDGFPDADLMLLLGAALKLLEPAPAFIRMATPVVIFGDTHGQFKDLIRMFRQVGTPPKTRVLFLGDYVDRCRKSIEILFLLLSFKVLYPNDVELLRGNHECAKLNRLYGFYEECRRFRGVRYWKLFQQVFNELPLCCLVGEKIICMHGGISPDIKSIDTLIKLKKPRTHNECDTGIALDLMWSDPATGADACCSWQFNKMRNASWMFGTDSVQDFNRMLDIDMVVRAHEMCKDGHQSYCEKLLWTVFSAPNYCGTDGNAASVMLVTADLRYSFLSLRPKLDKDKLSKEKAAELEKQNKNADIKSPNPNGLSFHKPTDVPDTQPTQSPTSTSPTLTPMATTSSVSSSSAASSTATGSSSKSSATKTSTTTTGSKTSGTTAST